MLGLARTRGNIEIFFRKGTSRLSKELCLGLGAALAFHALLFFSFQIVLPSHDERSLPLSPTAVEIDLGNSPSNPSLPSRLVLEPLEELPPPPLPELPFASYLPFQGRITIEEPDFSRLEKIPYTPLGDEI